MRTVRALPATLLAVLLVGAAGPASADLTVFAAGAATTRRAALGAALAAPFEPVGLEFEYARLPADGAAGRPALRTGLFNLLVGTPFRVGRRLQAYGAVGAGAYRERLEEHVRTGLAVAAGGGAYVRLAGPFRIRVDYRLLALGGDALHRRQRRVYAGFDVAF